MNTDVVTRSFDFTRSGANTAENVLSPTAVKTRGIKKVLILDTPDDPRLEAQPLYLSAINVKGKTRNVIYQATMGNTVYAWDADTGELLWKTNLGMPINGSTAIDSHNINVKWGIIGTPVIDRAAGAIYLCAWISSDKSGNWKTAEHFVFALDITTGTEKPGKAKLSLEQQQFNAGNGLPVITFKSIERKQRSALAIVNGAVIVCFGTIFESDDQARGWVIAVDIAKWQVAATWCSTARGAGGGIWMSGAGPAIQSDGSIWAVTGNGDFDGKTDFGESVVRLKYTPAAGSTKASLKLTGWWTPWTDDGRTGGNPQGEGAAAAAAAFAKLTAHPMPTNFRMVPHLARMGFRPAEMARGAWSDQDLGASGIVLVEKLGIALVSGKDGILYTINLANPGETAPPDLVAAKAPSNYAKLAASPILYTYFDPTMNPATTNPQTLNRLPENVTHHLHGTPVYWQNAAHGQMHFCGGENGNLRAWSIGANKQSGYLGCAAAVASAEVPPPGGMPGWSISLSANGNTDGIVWAMIPYGDANVNVTNGRLLAYDAANLSKFSDGSGEIVPLWDSQDWNWSFSHPKFNRPVAVDGKVLVPTYNGQVMVLGLA